MLRKLSTLCVRVGDWLGHFATYWFEAARSLEDLAWCLSLRRRRDLVLNTLSAIQEAKTCLEYARDPASLSESQVFMPAQVTPESLAAQATEEVAKAEMLLRELADYHY